MKFVITVKIDFGHSSGNLYYSDTTSDFMVFDIHDAKKFDHFDYAEDMTHLLPKTLYSHLEYVQLEIIEYKAV